MCVNRINRYIMVFLSIMLFVMLCRLPAYSASSEDIKYMIKKYYPDLTEVKESSSIKQRDANMIMYAFMNGYAEMLKLDPEDIEKIKKDKELFKSVVKAASEAYLNKVINMN